MGISVDDLWEIGEFAAALRIHERRGPTMPKFNGGYTVTIETQTMINGPADHQIGLMMARGPQETTEPEFEGSILTLWGIIDTVGGNGTMRGYFRNTHPTGDTSYGTSEATVRLRGEELIMEGKWQFIGGTGMFENLSGGGTFTDKQTPTGSTGTWTGDYKID
jgi:hypothetical protein